MESKLRGAKVYTIKTVCYQFNRRINQSLLITLRRIQSMKIDVMLSSYFNISTRSRRGDCTATSISSRWNPFIDVTCHMSFYQPKYAFYTYTAVTQILHIVNQVSLFTFLQSSLIFTASRCWSVSFTCSKSHYKLSIGVGTISSSASCGCFYTTIDARVTSSTSGSHINTSHDLEEIQWAKKKRATYTQTP